MQNQIDNLEYDLDLETESTRKVTKDKKTLENEIKVINNDQARDLDILKSREIEEKSEGKIVNAGKTLLQKKFQIANSVIEELKSKAEMLVENNEEQKKEIKNLTAKEV